MHSKRPLSFRILLLLGSFTALLSLWVLFRNGPSAETAAPPRSPAPPSALHPLPAGLPPRLVPPRSWKTHDGGEETELVLALDEVALREEDGRETILPLQPAATLATLPERVQALSGNGSTALPVAYPAGEERNEFQRRIVTKDLRLQVPEHAESDILQNLGLEKVQRPAYARDWLIVSAADPFAALAVVDRLRAIESITSADVLLAQQHVPRALPNDPLASSQWHLKQAGTAVAGTDIHVESVWNYPATEGLRGNGIRIGIVDDGTQITHPDLAPNADAGISWNWNGNNDNPNPLPGSWDDHGTAVAGVAAAVGNNGVGVTGVAPEATIVGMKLISAATTDAQDADAMGYRNDIIPIKNNSWGPADTGRGLYPTGPLMAAAFQDAVTQGRDGKGTILVWAGGNGKASSDNSNYDGYANSIYTLAVGAIDSRGNSSWYSEPGANLLICAPSSGVLGITTTDRTGTNGYNANNTTGDYPDRDYTNSFGGTSSAAPAVSGVVALMLEANPDLGWRDVQEILIRSAAQFRPGDNGWAVNGAGYHFHHSFGAGLVDAAAAVELAASWENLPPQEQRFADASLSLAIPNNQAAGVEHSFSFTETNHRVEHVTLHVRANHSYRGNLEITLTSPSGMTSRLAEVRGDSNAHYNWTFSSVHHWGESAAGSWTVRIADRSNTGNTGGGLFSYAGLTLYGSPAEKLNPAPQVTITSPLTGAGFSPGSTVAISVNAADLDIDGNPGTVQQVELFADGLSLGVLTAPPYEFSYTPEPGTHTLVATASDTDGAIGSSPPVVFTIGNLPPVITEAPLSSEGQAYVDEPLAVGDITAYDPEGGGVSFSYQWQSSTDAVVFTNEEGATDPALPLSPAHSGKLWRCLVTASDGTQMSAPFASVTVNLLARPVLQIHPGEAYTYTSGLVLKGNPEPLDRIALINEFSQGNSVSREWVEILMLQEGSLSHWDVQNASGDMLLFTNSSVWDDIPAGTLIIIYNGRTTKDQLLPPDDSDPSDRLMVLSSTDSQFFDQRYSPWPGYPDNGSAVVLSDESGAVVHALSYGNNTLYTPRLGAVGNNRSAYYRGDTETGATAAAQWGTAVANVAGSSAEPGLGVTPGTGNTPANEEWIDKLRTGTLLTPAPFRLGEETRLPVGLAFDESTGTLSGTISAENPDGIYRIVIERYNETDEVVSQSFSLILGDVGYESWVDGFDGLADPAAAADPDGDGLPNLIEYALGLDPTAADFPSPVILSASEGQISLAYGVSALAVGVEIQAEWATDLGPDAVWQSTEIETSILEESADARQLRSSLLIDPNIPRRFLRLRAVVTEE